MAQTGAESHDLSLSKLTDKDLSGQSDSGFSAAVLHEIVGDITKARQNSALQMSSEDLLFWDMNQAHKDLATDRYGQNERTASGYIDYNSGKHVAFTNGAALDAAQRELGGDLDQKLAWRTSTKEYQHGYSTVQQCTASGLCSQDDFLQKDSLKAKVHFGLEGEFQSAEATITNTDGSSERLAFNVEQNVTLVDIVHPDKSEDIRHFNYQGKLQSADHITNSGITRTTYDVDTGKTTAQ